MNQHPVIIFGSSRSDGNTRKAVSLVFPDSDYSWEDLTTLDISYFDYHHRNLEDDFIPLVERLLQHETLILATPVYWYTVSAPMKAFLDRWSDLLTIRKDLGRRLAGKKLFLITSYGSDFPHCFEEPIRLTCAYMGMNYGGCFYYYSGSEAATLEHNAANASQFRHTIRQANLHTERDSR